MLATNHMTQKPFRASFARMLAHLTIGFGISTGTAMFAGPAHSQTCDRCAGLNSPSCGCELERSGRPGPKSCSYHCVPKPSLGEMLLGRLDKIGDRIEANSKCNGDCQYQAPKSPSGIGPACGCESPQKPSCGCESPQISRIAVPLRNSPQRVSAVPPLHGDPSRFAVGSIGDKRSNNSASSQSTIPAIKKSEVMASRNSPQDLTDLAPDPMPTLPQTPFEPRNPTHNRIPAEETVHEIQSVPNSLKTISTDTPPVWVPSTPTKPPAELDPTLPDVLVDPFKDDARIRGTRQKMEGVLLTSDRQHSSNALRLAAPVQADGEPDGLPPSLETPARLTPKQRNQESLQFEATDSASNESSRVVPSSYKESTPVKVALRKVPSKGTSNETPQVSKIRVPQKR